MRSEETQTAKSPGGDSGEESAGADFSEARKVAARHDGHAHDDAVRDIVGAAR